MPITNLSPHCGLLGLVSLSIEAYICLKSWPIAPDARMTLTCKAQAEDCFNSQEPPASDASTATFSKLPQVARIQVSQLGSLAASSQN